MNPEQQPSRYGMVIDLDKCSGCGACTVACAVENNIPPGTPKVTDRTGITWMKVQEIHNNADYPSEDSVFVPMMCQQCGNAPCETVCPQNAVEIDPATGIVGQIAVRCLGCRYCVAACPYHARYFNWWDPKWPKGMEKTLNPAVSPRMRGVVEKCMMCLGRLHEARQAAATSGQPAVNPQDYVPACVESCPSRAMTFGDLADPSSEVAKLAKSDNAFRFLPRLGTDPKISYLSSRPWVRDLGGRMPIAITTEVHHG